MVLERPPGKSQVTLNINSGVKKTKRSSVQGTTVNNINGRVHIITCSTQIYLLPCFSPTKTRVVLERPPGKSEGTLNINSGVEKTRGPYVQGQGQ